MTASQFITEMPPKPGVGMEKKINSKDPLMQATLMRHSWFLNRVVHETADGRQQEVTFSEDFILPLLDTLSRFRIRIHDPPEKERKKDLWPKIACALNKAFDRVIDYPAYSKQYTEIIKNARKNLEQSTNKSGLSASYQHSPTQLSHVQKTCSCSPTSQFQ